MTTLFDLDSFSAEVRGQDEQIDDMLDGAEEIRNLINSRRGIMQQQQRADEIKSKLCDKLREEKMKVSGLDKRIRALEINDPELFKYIRKLEFVQDGIWCSKCNVMKNIGGRPTHYDSSPDDNRTQPEAHDMLKLQEEYRELENNFGILLNHLADIRNEYNVKIQQSVEIATQLEGKLKQMCRDAYKLGLTIGVETDEPESDIVVAPHMNMPAFNTTIKKEDLPAKPDFDLDKLLNEKISAMSADNLLGDD